MTGVMTVISDFYRLKQNPTLKQTEYISIWIFVMCAVALMLASLIRAIVLFILLEGSARLSCSHPACFPFCSGIFHVNPMQIQTPHNILLCTTCFSTTLRLSH